MKTWIFLMGIFFFGWGACWGFEGQVKTAYYIDENGEKGWVHLAEIDLKKAAFMNCTDAYNPGWLPSGHFVYLEPHDLKLIYKDKVHLFDYRFSITWKAEDCLLNDLSLMYSYLLVVKDGKNLQFRHDVFKKEAFLFNPTRLEGPFHKLTITETY